MTRSSSADLAQNAVRTCNVRKIHIFAGSLQEINEDTPFLEKLSYVLMEMADCEDIPDNLNDPLLERLFKAADTARMKQDTKESYMKSIIGEAEYEANLEDWKAEGLEEGLAKGMAEGQREVARKMKADGLSFELISGYTGLTADEIEML